MTARTEGDPEGFRLSFGAAIILVATRFAVELAVSVNRHVGIYDFMLYLSPV